MTIHIENESRIRLLKVNLEELAERVIEAALDYEGCPYEVEVSLLLTDNTGIREINRDHRNIDRATDVLSFPMLEYDIPSDFSCAETEIQGCFHPETGELLYDHMEALEAREMEDRQEAILRSLNILR